MRTTYIADGSFRQHVCVLLCEASPTRCITRARVRSTTSSVYVLNLAINCLGPLSLLAGMRLRVLTAFPTGYWHILYAHEYSNKILVSIALPQSTDWQLAGVPDCRWPQSFIPSIFSSLIIISTIIISVFLFCLLFIRCFPVGLSCSRVLIRVYSSLVYSTTVSSSILLLLLPATTEHIMLLHKM